MRWHSLIPLSLALLAGSPLRADPERTPCTKDAMLVFDGSGSMAGTDMNSATPHLAKVRQALARVLPSVAPMRDLGLMVYGPGPYNKCDNIELRLKPAAHSAEEIMAEVDSVAPAGQTPLTTSAQGSRRAALPGEARRDCASDRWRGDVRRRPLRLGPRAHGGGQAIDYSRYRLSGPRHASPRWPLQVEVPRRRDGRTIPLRRHRGRT